MRNSLRKILLGGLLAVGGLLCFTASADAQRFGISFGGRGGGWGGGGGGWGGGGWGRGGGGGRGTIDLGFGHYHLGSNRFHLGPSRYGYGSNYGGYGYGSGGYYGAGSVYQPYQSYGYTQPYSSSYTVPYTSSTAPVYEGTGLVLWNPDSNGRAITFDLDGRPYTLEPGYQVTLKTQPEWTVAFDSGNERGATQYGISDGKSYTFRYSDDQGWDLRESGE